MIPNTLRLDQRQFRDSGYLFLQNTSTITSGGKIALLVDERFVPYDDVKIINLDDNNDCTVTINGSMKQPLPKGMEIQINYLVRDIEITNNGSSTIAVNKIQMFYRNTGHTGKAKLQTLKTGVEFGAFLRGLSNLI